jgi:hypothetical protein
MSKSIFITWRTRWLDFQYKILTFKEKILISRFRYKILKIDNYKANKIDPDARKRWFKMSNHK